MTTPIFNIEGNEGGSVVVSVQVQESDGTASDLSGYTGTMQVRADPLDSTILATGTVTISGSTVTGTVAAADTVDWSAGYYDIRIVSSAGVVEYVVKGRIALEPTVTQP